MTRLARLFCAVGAMAALATPAAAEPFWHKAFWHKTLHAAFGENSPTSVADVPLPSRLEIEAPVKSYAELRFKGIQRQTLDLSCGAAALATLLHGYFGLPVDEAAVIRGIFATASPDDVKQISGAGFSMLELKRFAETEGLVAGGFKTDKPEDLRKLRAPVIALVDSRGYKHFVVVRSVRNDQVAFADPVFGNRVEPLQAFAKRWNGVILVAVYPGHKVNASFLETPPGAEDPRAVQLLMSRTYSPAMTFGPGDFY